MSHRPNKIVQTWLKTPTSGVVELAHDWRARHAPPLRLTGGLKFSGLERVRDHSYGKESGYFATRAGRIYFFLPISAHPKPFARRAPVYLAGDFNGWGDAIGRDEWRLNEASLDGQAVLLWTGRAEQFFSNPPQRFKFVTGEGRWFEVPTGAPNTVVDESGNRNLIVDVERTGFHLFAFTLDQPVELSQTQRMEWASSGTQEDVPLRPGPFFFQLATDLPLGARSEQGDTVFRLFAPRATKVTLYLIEPEDERGIAPAEQKFALAKREGESAGDRAVWEFVVEGDLHGWRYWYQIDGPRDEFGLFDPEQRVLDPYAVAAMGRKGSGLVIDAKRVRRKADGFVTPFWQDLIICEAHVRDLAAMAPVKMTDEERRGFTGLKRWVDSPGFYLNELGVNCVELQPIQEFDNESPEDYHWGYMTNNYFSPESSYALEPAKASGIQEFQDLVMAFHRRGIAVVLDVVYNHVGVPGHLMFIDKLYYFAGGLDGELSNWSGCGNDLRVDAAMATRLIIDSCTHLIETYGIDGFRFDLAELLGAEVLKEIEVVLKRVKPDVILIAEPWSFRGHIAGALTDTGWASWNDGYRGFLKDFVRGRGNRESFEYYLKGSPWYFAKWPAQTVNYVESHDGRTWIDEITENADGSGHLPTANDRRRTHLMAAVLFSSVGIPMISAGQDFLRSKHGVNNTYLRGDLNALDYRRAERFSGTQAYFSDWIAFRRSEQGSLLRHYSRATETYFRFWFAPDSLAVAVLYNADFSQGTEQLLFAINPMEHDVEVSLDEEVAEMRWIKIADHEHFKHKHSQHWTAPLDSPLWLPALGFGLWRASG
ncbi:MAG: glycoside hydrolase family 1 [Candidatus Synoicihabitans palmerolidicus]|nr:glycoside hydrolase family 1 [Candidatus Synoicihabitans palmerolidicus]